MSISKQFRALALGTAIGASALGISTAANAAEPVTACNPNNIFAVFQTAQGGKAFGRDGCVYGMPGGQPLALENYNLQDGREAQRFNREFSAAERQAASQAQREQRMREQQQRICNNAVTNTLGSLLNGGRPNLGALLRNGQNCM